MNQLPTNLLKRNIDPRLMMTIIILGIGYGFLIVMSFFAVSPEAQSNGLKEMPNIALAFILPLLLWYLYDRGYQVGWDDTGVYVRLPGFRLEGVFSTADRLARDYGRPPGLLGWFTYPGISFMRYEDMVSLSGNPDKRLGGKARYRAAAALYISGAANPPGIYNNLIGLDFDSFKRESFLDFMEVLYSKRPELVPKGWVKQIKKRADNDQ